MGDSPPFNMQLHAQQQLQNQHSTHVNQVTQLLKQWEDEHLTNGYDPVPFLTKLAEAIEQDTEIFLKKDPDPFDDRHPFRVDAHSGLGHCLKIIFRKETFMTKLVGDYLRDTYWSRQNMGFSGDQRTFELNVAACRLMLDIMPGLDTSAVFQDMDSQIQRLFGWAENSAEPLQSYAIGMLAAAMEVQDIAANFREQNAKLVPLMLKRLKTLQEEHVGPSNRDEVAAAAINHRPFAHLGQSTPPSSPSKTIDAEPPIKKRALTARHKENGGMSPRGLMSPPLFHDVRPLASNPHADSPNISSLTAAKKPARFMPLSTHPSRTPQEDVDSVLDSPLAKPSSLPTTNGIVNGDRSPPFHRLSTGSQSTANVSATNENPPPLTIPVTPVAPPNTPTMNRPAQVSTNDCSNSSWAEMESFVIGSFQMHPLTLATKQILILRYLTPMGEYQEFLSHVFEHNALDLIIKYTNLSESRDARLAFEALKFLGALLCHKKFSFEFINCQRMQHLMDIRRPSIAACGVAMCLYHMAYCEDTMERICLLPNYIIHQVVRYALWLLECSHDSSRCHAVMFFILALPFVVILEQFDNQDGIRKVYNVVATLPLLSQEDVDNSAANEDEQCAARQLIRHVFMCLKRYCETHLAVKAEQLTRESARNQPSSTPGSPQQQPYLPAPPYKPIRTSPEQIQENVNTLMQLMSIRAHWAPVDNFVNLSGIALLLKVIAYAYEWNYSGRAETVRSALDALAICVVMPKAQLQLCESVDLPNDSISMGMNIILGAAEGEIVADADVQRSALNVIGNCVCAPEHRIGGASARFVVGSPRKKAIMRSSEEIIAKMWDTVRTNNGIMVLLQLMTVKTRLTEADSIRMLACRALAGLARSETVRQIIGKLPIFTDGQLQMLMRDPILQDRRQEHVQFQKYALQLLERVSGKPSCNELEASLANIHKANVVAQTRIQFNERQLYQLIHQHLLNQGLSATAQQLQLEAGLPEPPPAPHPPARPVPASAFPSTVSHRGSMPTATPTSSRSRSVVSSSVHCCSGASGSSTTSRLVTSSSPVEATLSTPIKLNLSSTRRAETPRNDTNQPSRILQKQTSYENNAGLPVISSANPLNTINQQEVSLDAIITEYLKNQHALCKNPVATCPQFNLFKHHKCPDPRDRSHVAVNFAMRVSQRQMSCRGGLEGASLDRRLVHSRFCPVKTFRLGDEDAFFTCAAFDHQNQRLLMGTFEGSMKIFNLHTGMEEGSYQCHDSYVYRLEPSRCGKLLLTSATWRRPLSALYTMDRFFTLVFPFDEEEYVEFSKVSQNRIIGTKAELASIYDVETGTKLAELRPDLSNNYTKNRATYSPTDELVLSDGVLWDVNAHKAIHKFDKLNQSLSGVFHPNGLEVVSNTEVWDLRTFHLLRTVPALDQCEVKFTPAGDVLYCVSMETETDEDSSFESSFKTLDARDYSSIATIDVKRNIYDLALNSCGTQLALVENQGMFESVHESTVRLYDIGRRRDDDDEGEEEEDEDHMDDGSNDDDDDGSSSTSSSDDDGDAAHDVFDVLDGDFHDDSGPEGNGGDAAAAAMADGQEEAAEGNPGAQGDEAQANASSSDSVFSLSSGDNDWETTSSYDETGQSENASSSEDDAVFDFLNNPS